jgi:predicted enzyme related to lactoylglutathione lyase
MPLHGAMLFVKDLPRMAAFHGGVLGLQRIPIDSPPRPHEQGATKLTFTVRNVDETLASIEGMGLPVLRRPWGGIEAVDPEGNIFALSPRT